MASSTKRGRAMPKLSPRHLVLIVDHARRGAKIGSFGKALGRRWRTAARSGLADSAPLADIRKTITKPRAQQSD
jgi:hypothetical protein